MKLSKSGSDREGWTRDPGLSDTSGGPETSKAGDKRSDRRRNCEGDTCDEGLAIFVWKLRPFRLFAGAVLRLSWSSIASFGGSSWSVERRECHGTDHKNIG